MSDAAYIILEYLASLALISALAATLFVGIALLMIAQQVASFMVKNSRKIAARAFRLLLERSVTAWKVSRTPVETEVS